MNRRTLIASFGAAALAGCVGGDPDEGAAETPVESPTDAPSLTEAPTEAPRDATTEEPTDAPELGVDPDEADCPPIRRIERVVCYPEVGSDDSPMALLPSADRVDLPAGSVDFTLRNGTDAVFEINFYAWSVWKRVDGEWFHIAPSGWNQPLMYLEPGAEHVWSLAVDNDGYRSEPPDPQSTTDSVALSGLGGGTYVFTARGWFEGQSYENATGFGARFELDGDSVILEPLGVEETERDGDTVVVRTDAEETEHTRMAAFVVERAVETDAEATRVITEQLLQASFRGRVDPLRNTLPYFEDGVETVRLEQPDGTTPPFGVRAEEYVEYEGETYRVTAEELEEAE